MKLKERLSRQNNASMKLLNNRTENSRDSMVADTLPRGPYISSAVGKYPAGAPNSKVLAGNAVIGDRLRSGAENILKRNPTSS